MGLNKETLAWIAELSGVSVEDITTKINSEKEESITKPQGQLFSEEELSKRDSSKYKEGKEAGTEMLVKDLKKTYGYDFEGKDVDSFLSHHNEQLKSKYSKGSNERVSELETDLKKQRATFEEEINNYKTKYETLNKTVFEQNIDNSLLFASPKNLTMDAKRIVSLFKMENPPIEVDGVVGVKGKDGNPIKDPKTGEIIPHTKIYQDWVVSEKFVSGTPGRGGGNEFGKTGYNAKDPRSFQEEWQKKNPDKSPNSVEYQNDYKEWRKEATAA